MERGFVNIKHIGLTIEKCGWEYTKTQTLRYWVPVMYVGTLICVNNHSRMNTRHHCTVTSPQHPLDEITKSLHNAQ